MARPDGTIAWRRLVAEGGAIVLSILLAFAIDAWWDERQERLEERRVTESLQQDFTRNRVAVERAIALHTAATERVSRLDRMGAAEIRALPQDSVAVLVGAIFVPHSFDAELGTVDALVGAGRLGVLHAPELREALTRFVNVVEDGEEDVRFIQEFVTKVWEASMDHGGPWNVPSGVNRGGGPDFLPEPSPETLVQIRSDPRLMSLVRQLRFLAWVYVGELRRMLEQIELILAILEEGSD